MYEGIKTIGTTVEVVIRVKEQERRVASLEANLGLEQIMV